MSSSVQQSNTTQSNEQAPHDAVFSALDRFDMGISNEQALQAISHCIHKTTWSYARKMAYIRDFTPYLDTHTQSRVQFLIREFVQPENISYEISSDPSLSPSKQPSERMSIDVHLCRLAMRLGDSRLIQLYFIMRHLTTQQQGSGAIDIPVLVDYLKQHDLYTRSSFYRWLRNGQRKNYWSLDRKNERIFITSLPRLAEYLMYVLDDTDIALFIGENAPGRKRVWIEVHNGVGKHQGLSLFHARVFGAWIALHGHKTVANETCASLFGVSVRWIQQWKHMLDIQHTVNFARDYRAPLTHTPDHAVNAQNGHIWQLPNTYHTPGSVEKNNAIGNSRRVRQRVNRVLVLRDINPDSYVDVGELSVRYFEQTKKTPAYKVADKWQRKHRQPFDRPQYSRAAMLSHGDVGVWDYEGHEGVFCVA